MLSAYRLTLDEHGVEEINDFTTRSDTVEAFNKATKRKSVFSARLEYISMNTSGVNEPITKVRLIDYFERLE